jgi:hypothetical protein
MYKIKDNTRLSSTSNDASASPEITSEMTSRSQEDLKGESKKMSYVKLGEKAKKKAWYNVIYPSYKSRTEEYKKLFNIPEDERLLVGKCDSQFNLKGIKSSLCNILVVFNQVFSTFSRAHTQKM